MKKIISVKFIIIAFTIILSSCKEEENTPINNQLNGQWSLVNVSCECLPSELKYGEHVWKFDLTKNTVTVENTVEKLLQILETGNYEFELTDSTIKINTVTYDYYFKDGKLYLADDPEVDGPLMEFVKFE